MLVDFKIYRGLAEQLFTETGAVNPKLVIEDGAWYLTDDAKLYLGVQGDNGLTLKPINENSANIDPEVLEALRSEIAGKADADHTHDEYLTEHQSLENYYTKEDVYTKEEVDELIPSLDGYAKSADVTAEIAEAIEAHEGLAKKEEVLEVKTKLEAEVLPTVEQAVQKVETVVPTIQELAEKAATQDWVKDQKYLQNKYEVLPVEGLLVSYRDGEIRLNTERVVPELQKVGSGGNPNLFYVTFRAYAPEGATHAIESDGVQTDPKPLALGTDAYGRSYTTIWSAVASWDGSKWTKYGDLSWSASYEDPYKYLGFNYTFDWYKGEDVKNEDGEEIFVGDYVSTDKVRVILTNDKCHNDFVSDAVNKRIDEKVAEIKLDADLSEYAKLSDISEFIKEIPDEYVTEAELTEATKGYVNAEFVDKKIAEAQLADKEADLEAYYTKSEVDALIPDVSKFITEVPAEYITEEELENKGFLTQHQDLREYAKKSEIPSVEGLASESYVDEKVAEIKIPEVDLSGYYNKEEVDQKLSNIKIPEVDTSNFVSNEVLADALSLKADKVLFTEDKFIKNSVGGFIVGESVKDLTIADLFAKLLGLSNEPSDGPVEPDEPKSLIDRIIANEVPMYAVTADAEFVKIPFNYMEMTEAEAALPCTESGFYQIKDAGGNVIESGYQEMQANSDDVYYLIAFPKEVDYNSMITIQGYDTRKNLWVDAEKFDMTTDIDTISELCAEFGIDISHVDQSAYTLYMWEDLPSGSLLRYIINE